MTKKVAEIGLAVFWFALAASVLMVGVSGSSWLRQESRLAEMQAEREGEAYQAVKVLIGMGMEAAVYATARGMQDSGLLDKAEADSIAVDAMTTFEKLQPRLGKLLRSVDTRVFGGGNVGQEGYGHEEAPSFFGKKDEAKKEEEKKQEW